MLENQLSGFNLRVDSPENRLRLVKPSTRVQTRLNPQTKEALDILRHARVYEPEIFYKSSENMSEVPNESVQLIVTSPPYNVGKEYGKHDDKMDVEAYYSLLNRVWVECKRVLCKGGRIAVNVANTGRQPYIPLNSIIINQLLSLGFHMRGEIIWDKGASVGISTAWGSWRKASNPTLRDVNEFIMLFTKDEIPLVESEHEHIVVFSKDAYRLSSRNNISTITANEFTEYTKSIWRFPTSNPINGHPAPFPEELPKRLIQLYTFLGDTVLDPFLGSGTTCKVAKAWGRKSIGYEIDESYRPIIEKRIAEAEQLAIPLETFMTNNGQNIDDYEPFDTLRNSETNASS
ncbi:MAG: site-specific DNA-methyltransferase [Nitrososphaerota archaeon]|nr:site-specific DNA-methyltransferase [Nitrososphaerota archaeon]MDG7051160.1 site-specific DNA-methyltransferase [Nitrososphaerota archaeon]